MAEICSGCWEDTSLQAERFPSCVLIEGLACAHPLCVNCARHWSLTGICRACYPRVDAQTESVVSPSFNFGRGYRHANR